MSDKQQLNAIFETVYEKSIPLKESFSKDYNRYDDRLLNEQQLNEDVDHARLRIRLDTVQSILDKLLDSSQLSTWKFSDNSMSALQLEMIDFLEEEYDRFEDAYKRFKRAYQEILVRG
jgi:hypothetical protein